METVDLHTYQQNKDYSIKQARLVRNEKAATDTTPTLDAATKAEGSGNTKNNIPWTPDENE